ncbi:MAG: LptE family protein [Candidatus Omnitrophica bacterium]|nr:LptE family protein [Candidatus Omnitrophota bacterium]
MLKRKNNLIIASFILLSASLSLASGCGYSTHSAFISQYRTVYVEPFINKVDFTQEKYIANKYRTYKPLLETDVTHAVVDKFLFDGSLKPVPRENARLILKGEVVQFRRDPLRYDADNETVLEYRINIVVNISLRDVQEDKILWEENGFTGDTTYFVSGSSIKSDDQATQDAIADLARRIVERTVEAW